MSTKNQDQNQKELHKEAKQKKLDCTKKQLEDFEKKNKNLEKALEMAKIKASLEEIKQNLSIDHIIVTPKDQEYNPKLVILFSIH